MIYNTCIMGLHPSDLYQLEDIGALCGSLRDVPPAKYMWVDLNIHVPNHENTQHAAIFRQNHLDMLEANSIAKFTREVERWAAHAQRLRVVCAASLPEEAYTFIQQSEKIDRAMLFCSSKVRADQLMRSYSKIKVACFGSWEVVRIINLWEIEEETCLLVFEDESIEAINRHYANILSLTDRNNIVPLKAKQQFQLYLQQILTNQRRPLQKLVQEYQKCRSSKQEMIPFLERHFVASSLLVEKLNRLLISTFNPKKLAYLRYIINDIFHAIKESFPSLDQLPIRQYYALVEVNEAQLKKLSFAKSKYITFTRFLTATADQTERNLVCNQIQFIIELSPKVSGQFNNGYLQSQNKIVFNLGTYFKVMNYNPANKSVSLAPLQLADNLDLVLEKDEHRICVNRLYQDRQQRKYDGQWWSLVLSHTEQAANEYISEKIKVLSRDDDKNRILQYRISIIARKLKSNQTEDYETMISELQRQDEPQYPEYFIQCLCLGCEFYYCNERTQKFKDTIKKIEWLKERLVSENLKNKFFLLKLAFELSRADNGENIQAIMLRLQQFQRSVVKSKQYLCEDLYHFLLRVKLKASSQLNQAAKSLEIINHLLQVYNICEGRTSLEFIKFSHQRASILATQNGRIAQEQINKKRRLFQSSVQLETLRRQSYFVEIGIINLDFYC